MSKGFTHEAAVGASVEWYTPKSVFDALGVKFDLDPCTPGGGLTHVPADNHYTKKEDGLESEWFGRVWCNPPYGRGINGWLKKCAEHGEAIALVPARTDAAWFHEATRTADLILFPRGRIKFHPGHKGAPNSGSPGVGNVFIAWGKWSASVLNAANIDGAKFERKIA